MVERVGAMETTPLAQVELVANTLGARIGQKGQSPRVVSGGVKAAADLLNWFDKEQSKELLKSIEKRNPKLGGTGNVIFLLNDNVASSGIKDDFLIFLELTNNLDNPVLGRLNLRKSLGSKITKEVDQDDLVIAMKNASPELKKAIYSTMSKRAVEALEEQLGFLGPKRLSEIESAQDWVIQIVRELEEDEEIILDTGGSDIVVQ